MVLAHAERVGWRRVFNFREPVDAYRVGGLSLFLARRCRSIGGVQLLAELRGLDPRRSSRDPMAAPEVIDAAFGTRRSQPVGTLRRLRLGLLAVVTAIHR